MSASTVVPVRVARLDRSDMGALAAFYRAAGWDASASAESVAAGVMSFVANGPFSGDGDLAVAVFVDERIVGYLGTIPTRFWDGKQLTPARWLKGFMVLEAHRNGPIGFMLIKELSKHLDVAGAMTVAEPARRLMQAVGFREIGTVPNYLSVLRAKRFLSALDPERMGLDSMSPARRAAIRLIGGEPLVSIASAALSAALGMCDLIHRRRSRGLRVSVASSPPAAEEIDGLWRQLQANVAFVPCRSGAYIAWRYAGGRDDYRFIAVREGGALSALAVVRAPRRIDDPRLSGLRLGLVVDLMADPRNGRVVASALGAARAWAKNEGCDAILLTISHGSIRSHARRAGYVAVPGNVRFMLRVGAADMAAPALDATWLTRGDAWGDDI